MEKKSTKILKLPNTHFPLLVYTVILYLACIGFSFHQLNILVFIWENLESSCFCSLHRATTINFGEVLLRSLISSAEVSPESFPLLKLFHHCTSPLNSQNIRIAKTSKTFQTPTKIKFYLFYLQIFFVVKKARSQPFPSRQGLAIVVSSTEGLADNSQTKDTHNAHVSIDMNKPMRRPWWLIQKKCGTQIIFHQRKARTFRCFFMLYRYSWNFVSRTFPSLSLASLSSVWMPTDYSLFVIGGKKRNKIYHTEWKFNARANRLSPSLPKKLRNSYS